MNFEAVLNELLDMKDTFGKLREITGYGTL